MKSLIFVLIFASFFQTTVIPFDLVLLILISRSYLKSDKANYYLALGFGLLVGHLNLSPLGFQSLVYLLTAAATSSLSKVRLANNPLVIIPLSFAFLSINQFNNWNFSNILIISFLSLPIFYLVRLWEERFIVQRDIKLKI